MAEFVLSAVSPTICSRQRGLGRRIPGGLGMATALRAPASARSATSTASAATLWRPGLPAMLKQGYEQKWRPACRDFRHAGELIPPSVRARHLRLLAK